MSYDLVKSIRELIQQGIGDTARLEYILERLENGKYLFLKDQKYLENLLVSKERTGFENIRSNPESHSLKTLENNLKELNNQLEKAAKVRGKGQVMPSSESKLISEDQRLIRDSHKQFKNESLTLALSVILGFISFQGIGHIYIGKVARGIGILILSLLLSTLGVSYFVGLIAKNYLPSSVILYFMPVIIIGYFGLYVFQILDSHKLCVTYNRYLSQHGESPPWW